MVNIKTALHFGVSSISTVFVIRKVIRPEIPSVFISSEKFQLTQAMATMIFFAVLMLFAAIGMIREKNNDYNT